MVYSLRSDYQFVDGQQSGYLRIMRFSPADNTIHVSTYSPTQDKLFPIPGTNSTWRSMNGFADFTLIETAPYRPGRMPATWSGLLNRITSGTRFPTTVLLCR